MGYQFKKYNFAGNIESAMIFMTQAPFSLSCKDDELWCIVNDDSGQKYYDKDPSRAICFAYIDWYNDTFLKFENDLKRKFIKKT